jgi:hypothetical protein
MGDSFDEVLFETDFVTNRPIGSVLTIPMWEAVSSKVLQADSMTFSFQLLSQASQAQS